MNEAPNGSANTGNTKQYSRVSSSKYYCFTLWAPEGSMPKRGSIDHDYNIWDLYPAWQELKDAIINSCVVEKFTYQLEWNDTGDNVHMQGAIVYKTKGRPMENFCRNSDLKRTHWVKKSNTSTVMEMLRYT